MLLLALTFACAPAEPPVCETFPDAPEAVPGTLENADGCGWWSLAVGEKLVVNVYMSEPDHSCTAELGEGLSLPYDPIYTNMADDAPKMTFQIEATAAATASDVLLECTEGTVWAARVDVTSE